jgi:Tuberculosis necrotizing toxin
MYVDPQKARQEEQERQAKLQAERKRQAKLRQQEEDRNAKLREEENQRAKQRAKAKESESSEGKNSEVKPKNKKPIEQKPEGKKAQNPQTSETKKPDKGTNQTEIAPLNVSTAPVSGQPSLTTPESKPQKPLDRKARTWTGEGDAEPEPQPAAHPIQRSEKEIAYREEVARKQAVKQEERRQKRLQEETKPTETQPEANESSSAPLFPAKPDIKIAASSLSPGVLGTLSEPHLLKSETPLKVNSPTPAEQLALQPSGLVSPVITFQETLKTNALNRLQQNRTRLDQSQQRFSDPDPKNQNWNALRQQSTVVATLNAREQIAKKKLLEAYRNATGDRVSSPFPLFNGFTSPAERRQLALGFYQKQLGPQWKPLAPQIESLINEIYVADSLRAGLYAQEPALAVLTPWELQRANTPEENRELQRKIHGEFGLARGGIQQLEKLLQTDKNSAVALKFDQVVGQTLAGIKDPKQRQQVLDWVEQQQQAEQDRQTQDTMGLAAATFMAVGASTLGVGSLALIFGGIGAFQGGKMSIDALSQAGVNQDALKAGGAGGQRLTAMNPHQAQMDYQMAMVNVGLSLLDAGVAVNSIRQVLNSRQAVQAFSKLKPHQVEQFAEATRLGQAGKAAEAQKKLQQLEGEVGEETFKEVTRTGGRLGLSNESVRSIKNVFFKDTDEFASTFDKAGVLTQATRKKSFDLYKQGKWSELEKLFKENNINNSWPPAFGGFNIVDDVTIEVGQKYDRFGGALGNYNGQGVPKLGGNFTSPMPNGKSYGFEQRSLNKAENSYDFHYEIEVLKDLPFKGQTANIIPWFNQVGGGKQTMWKIPIDPATGYPKTWNQLAQEGYVKIVIKDNPSGKYPDLVNTVIKK